MKKLLYFILSFALVCNAQKIQVFNSSGANGKIVTMSGNAAIAADGTVTVAAGSGLPSQSSNSGKLLTTNGSAASWAAISTFLGGNLNAISGLTSAADKLPYFTGSGAASVADFTAQARTFVAANTVGAQRTALGATTLGAALFTATNPSAKTYLEIQTDNSVTTQSAATHLAALGGASLTADQAFSGVNTFGVTNTTTANATTVNATTVNGALAGNATTATALQTGRTFSGTGDATWTSGAFDGSANETAAVTVVKINGVSLAGLSTGILKNTTTTGAPSIAVAGDFPTLNQSTTGSAATLTTSRTINGVSFNGSASIIDCDLAWFGAGTDGNLASGAGTTTLVKDMYYNNVTLTAGDKIVLKGFKLFVSGTLDITAADASAIVASTGMNGGNASTSTAGAAPTQVSTFAGSVGAGVNGLTGKTGATSVTNGTSGTAAGPPGNGGKGGDSGAGGTAVAGSIAGGTAATAASIASTLPILRIETNFLRGSTLIQAGGSGSTGGSGGGTSGVTGGGSGGSGNGGCVGVIFAAAINRGGSTPASCIDFRGGNGGNGGDAVSNTGGGGGGSGAGGGGWIYVVVGSLSGSTATNCIDASGGNGGNGGNGLTTGVGGNGGHGGNGGRITLINISAHTITTLDNTGTSDSGTTSGSGTVGGTGGTGASTKLSL